MAFGPFLAARPPRYVFWFCRSSLIDRAPQNPSVTTDIICLRALQGDVETWICQVEIPSLFFFHSSQHRHACRLLFESCIANNITSLLKNIPPNAAQPTKRDNVEKRRGSQTDRPVELCMLSASMATMIRGLAASLIFLLSIVSPAAAGTNTQFITGTSITGVTQQLAVDRTPALYTGDFGDCLDGQSLLDITKFDAAYYTDNSTVLFHLDGKASTVNESLVMHISMDAYGENRFQMTFDPCTVNINSLCPLNASVPVTGWAVFSVGPQQVGDIPSLAFTIPDFEGSVRLQIFGNSTQSEIACFQASLTNGKTMAYPHVISPILAIFVLVAMLASFATAVREVSIPAMRTHYAHSLSVMILFETFQSIFFSGALQLEFPSVLSAWWSNFAWSAGQIYSDSVVRTASLSSGIRGNSSEVGKVRPSASLVTSGASLAEQIYGRSSLVGRETTHQLLRRYNASNPYDYTWAGSPISPGVVLPGTWTGFPGTLSALDLPAADAFALGLIWLLVLIAILVFLLAAFKLSTEALIKTRMIEEHRLRYFRGHWAQYIVIIVLRTLFASFAMITTLACYQFSTGGSPGSMALAAIIFVAFLLGVGGLVARACYTRLRDGRYVVEPDRIVFVRATVWQFVPLIFPSRHSSLEKAESRQRAEKKVGSLPFVRIHWVHHDDDENTSNRQHHTTVHQDEPYVKQFGWLTARYRRTRWWFPVCQLGYQLVRAAIVGGGSATPMAQVYCLLIYDILALAALVMVGPFEGRRNTALAVWMLGLAKVLTTGLSVAFLPALGVGRMVVTAVGIIIVVVQGFLAVGAMVLVALGAVSSYMSVARRGDEDPDAPQARPFRPAGLASTRTRYLAHLERSAPDISKAQRRRLAEEEAAAAAAVGPSFRVKSVRRVSKIYDEDEDAFVAALAGGGVIAVAVSKLPEPGRTGSVRSAHSRRSSLPPSARPYRASWSSQDFAEWDALERPSGGPPEGVATRRLSSYSQYGLPFSTLDTFMEEEDAVIYSHDNDMDSGDLEMEKDGMSIASSRTVTESPEPRTLSTPVSSGPSSMTAVETPEHPGHGL